MKRKLFSILSVVTLSAMILAGCGGQQPNGGSTSSDTITVGGLAPLTGDVAVYGTAARKGVDLAFEEINKAGGVLGKKLVYNVLDEKGDVNEAVTAFNKLLSQNITALIGDVTSKPTIAVAELAAAEKLPMITATATAADVTTYGDNIFRVCFLDPTQGKAMAEFASKTLKAKTAAVLYNTSDDYSIGLSEAFKAKADELGLKVVNYEGYGNDDKDFKAQLTKIASSNVDVLLLPDYYNKVALIASQVKEVGIKAKLLGADGWDGVIGAVNKDNMDSVNGAYFCNHYSVNDESQVVKNFLASFKAKYNEEPNSFAALGYDAAYIMAKAIEKAGSTDKAAIVKAMAETNIDGVTGNITFNKGGDPVKSISIIKIENGAYVLDSKITAE